MGAPIKGRGRAIHGRVQSSTQHRVPARAGGGAWSVKASAESLGGTGSCGYGIKANGYSELSTVPQGTSSDFSALGNLPCGTVMNIMNPANGKVVQAAKQDVGAGSSFLPVMGLYPQTVSDLGLQGGAMTVVISRADGAPLHPVRGTPASAGSGTPSATTTTSGGGGLDLLTVLNDLVTGNISDLAASLAVAAAVGVKDVAVALADLIIIPLWHRNQRAVFYYYDVYLLQRNAPAGTPAAWKTWPWTAAFWGLGYALLFTNGDEGVLTPAPVRNSRLARHTRRLQAIPAHRSLVKPKDVKGKTPKQPKPKVSKAEVSQVGTLTTTRNRPVKVSGTVEGRTNASGTVSDTPIKRVGTGTPTQQTTRKGEANSPFPESHPGNSGGGLSPPTRGGVTQNPPKAGGR